ncbi:hypothetical protein ACMA5I_10345 [Paracoccaceae bacterium GXU_MW_L88]
MNIFQYVRDQEFSYKNDTIEVVEGYSFSMYDTLRLVELYWANKYKEKYVDPILGELPFDTIVKAPTLKEAEATDFDYSDVLLPPKKGVYEARVKAMFQQKATREYMDETNFSKFLNEFCLTRAKYGGVLTKDTKDGEKVVNWHNVIVDQTDIMSGVIIERHLYTPAELKAKAGTWENVDDALALAEEVKENRDDHDNESLGHFIEVYELHGELPMSLIEEDGNPHEFKRMMFVLAGVNDVDTDEDDNEIENGIILYQSEEKKSPYRYLARNPIAGRGLGVGVIEDLFEQQKWHNFTLSEELRIVTIAGKVFFETNNEKVPRNMKELDHMTVIRNSDDNEYFRQVNTAPAGLPSLQAIRENLDVSRRDITGMHEGVSGEQTKSNTPFRLAALQSIEGHARYDKYREEIGIFLEELITEDVLPKALKAYRERDEIYTSFDTSELALIDTAITNTFIKDEILEGRVVSPMQIEDFKRELGRYGSKRYVTAIKDLLKDADASVRVITTNEKRNRSVFFETRVSLIQLLGVEHPYSQAMIRSIITESGITEDELQLAIDQQIPATGNPSQVQGEELAKEEQSPVEQVA